MWKNSSYGKILEVDVVILKIIYLNKNLKNIKLNKVKYIN